MTASSSITVRVLSLAVLVLSLAPLGSIYVFFLGLGAGNLMRYYNDQPQQQQHSDGSDAASSSTLSSSLQADGIWMNAPNVTQMTLDEIVKEFVKVLQLQQQQHPVLWIPNKSAQFLYHLHIVLPWILSFVLGIFIPCLLSILTLLRRRRRRRTRRPQRHQQHNEDDDNHDDDDDDEEEEEDSSYHERSTRDKRIIKRLMYHLEPYTKVLRSEDQVIVTTSSLSSLYRHREEEEEDATNESSSQQQQQQQLLQWNIPGPGVRNHHHNNIQRITRSKQREQSPAPTSPLVQRTVHGLCGICLDTFHIGQSVTWSSNPACQHCFHDTCIQSWLLRVYKQTNNTSPPCPCCRRPFFTK